MESNSKYGQKLTIALIRLMYSGLGFFIVVTHRGILQATSKMQLTLNNPPMAD
jgi:hypothetical protein